VITQEENESRLAYLLRVAAAFAEQNGASVIDYDKTTCDGDCLSHELRNEIETSEAIQRELAEARKQSERWERIAKACNCPTHEADKAILRGQLAEARESRNFFADLVSDLDSKLEMIADRLKESQLQLQCLDEQYPSKTTPVVMTRNEQALAAVKGGSDE
jgi:hypothetical protein